MFRIWNLFVDVVMCYTAEKNLERCMLDYGGRRTVPEYMNNTC